MNEGTMVLKQKIWLVWVGFLLNGSKNKCHNTFPAAIVKYLRDNGRTDWMMRSFVNLA
jgi:hypothetical protein